MPNKAVSYMIAVTAAIGMVVFNSGCSQTAKRSCPPEQSKIFSEEREKLKRENAELKKELEKLKNAPPKIIEKLMEFPPNAEPGKCYARVFRPGSYKVVAKKKIKIQEETPDIRISPPKYKWVEKKILVKEAVYKLKRIPPVYRTETQKVLVSKAHKEWKKFTKEECLKDPIKCGLKDKKSLNAFTGEIVCLVEVPDLYKTVTKKILVKPARVEKVMVSPPVYKTIRVKKLIEEPKAQKYVQPAIYETVETEAKDRNESIEWKEVICLNLVTEDLVKKLQRILKKEGLYEGPIDGIYGSKTKSALIEYQERYGLFSGALTIETLQRMGFKNSEIRNSYKIR